MVALLPAKPSPKAPAMTSDLIARIEAAQADVRDVLELAFFDIYGREPDKVHIPQWNQWRDREISFHRFLDAEAYLDAAMMLVPEGWRYGIMGRAGYTECGIGPEEKDAVYTGRSETPALALAAASLKAKDASDD